MLPLTIALRYLRGKSGANAAPLLARISMLALAVGSGAMLVLFSVFNGFEGVIQNLYTAFYAEMRITPAGGKFFAVSDAQLAQIATIPHVAAIAPVIEDNVLVHTEEEQIVVTVKGITPQYFRVNDLKPYIAAGRDSVHVGAIPTAIVGAHIAARLGLQPDNPFSRITLNYPNRAVQNPVLNPTDAYSTLELRPDGIFKVQEEFDTRYVLAPLPLVQELFRREGAASSLELKLTPGANAAAVQRDLRALMGPGFIVETRYEQNRTLNGVMRSEKWATYAILLFILLIASVNMIGAMSLLVLEKRRDAAILTAMGTRRGAIRRIFLLEGMLWAAVGGGAGLVAGGLLCLGQQRWGWVKLSGDFIIDAYPVAIQPWDVAIVLLTVLAVGLLAAVWPAWRAGHHAALSEV